MPKDWSQRTSMQKIVQNATKHTKSIAERQFGSKHLNKNFFVLGKKLNETIKKFVHKIQEQGDEREKKLLKEMMAF